MDINWYPGHMAKAKRMLEENLKLIDVVVELIDARAPLATRNPDFDSLFSKHKRVVILNKSDLASASGTKIWVEYFRSRGITAIDFASTGNARKKDVTDAIEKAASEKVERMKAKGIIKTVRVMVVGIPNVGKSTFINRIAGGVRAKAGDKPGVTKGKQWVKITPYLELMDTPGLLWPKLEDPYLAKHLAYIGSINDDIMDTERLAGDLLYELIEKCPDAVKNRYQGTDIGMDPGALLDAVCISRGFRLQGGILDTQRAARIVLDEFRACRIVKTTLEMPDYVKCDG